MTGSDLLKILEYSIPVNNNQTGWFYYFSGIRMEFSPSAELGKRVYKITMEDGSPFDEKKIYTIAVMDKTVPDNLIIDCSITETTIFSILKQQIQSLKTISPSNDNRFIIK